MLNENEIGQVAALSALIDRLVEMGEQVRQEVDNLRAKQEAIREMRVHAKQEIRRIREEAEARGPVEPSSKAQQIIEAAKAGAAAGHPMFGPVRCSSTSLNGAHCCLDAGHAGSRHRSANGLGWGS